MTKNSAWENYRSLTNARIALGRAGGSLTTSEMLSFRSDHALAKDAVWTDLNIEDLKEQLESIGCSTLSLQSKANNREVFIQRPDLGRVLNQSSIDLLNANKKQYDISISIADGLSAMAIQKHAINFLESLLPKLSSFNLAPISIINQGRVAISDSVGQLLKSKIAIILIGERPGLTSPYSMGIYFTYGPKIGNTDEKRNCISNIRKEGLSYEYAAQKLVFLLTESLRNKLSGVDLKDTFDNRLLKDESTEN
ncbi:hypothetical protein LCGC14_2605110 [marine sediment metagenome]